MLIIFFMNWIVFQKTTSSNAQSFLYSSEDCSARTLSVHEILLQIRTFQFWSSVNKWLMQYSCFNSKLLLPHQERKKGKAKLYVTPLYWLRGMFYNFSGCFPPICTRMRIICAKTKQKKKNLNQENWNENFSFIWRKTEWQKEK